MQSMRKRAKQGMEAEVFRCSELIFFPPAILLSHMHYVTLYVITVIVYIMLYYIKKKKNCNDVITGWKV